MGVCMWPHGYRAGVSLKLKGILVTLLVYDCGFQIELRRAFLQMIYCVFTYTQYPNFTQELHSH